MARGSASGTRRANCGRRCLTPLLALLAGACSGADERLNVVVIVLDTARPDYLSAYGHPRPTTPHLEEFARAATRFDRAYSTSCWTLPSHASLFTGELPEVHGATQAGIQTAPGMPLLAERLSEVGYQTAGFTNNIWVSAASGLDRGFEAYYDRSHFIDQRYGPDGQHWTVQDVRHWIAEERDPSRPAFVFVNLIEPHMPYYPPWEAAEPFLESRTVWEQGTLTLFPPKRPTGPTVRHYLRRKPIEEREWQLLRALYEGDLRMVDEILRRILKALDAALDPERTLVFVLSDHGENLGEHDHIEHHFNLYDTNIRIALLARGPGFARGAIERRLAHIADVDATVRAAAGIDAPPAPGTLDLRSGLVEERVLRASLDYPRISLGVFPPASAEAGGPLDRYKRALVAAVGPRWKMLRGSDGQLEVYDLLEDPAELHPLDPESIDPRARRSLEAALDALTPSATPGPAPTPHDPAVIEALRALGYTR